MKFKDLILLFENEIDNVKQNKQPTTRFIVVAYYNVLKKVKERYGCNEKVTDARIKELDLTVYMKDKLITLSKKNVPKYLKKQEKEKHLRVDLKNFIGIGNKKADELISQGLKTINQLKQKKWFEKLNKDSQMMLTHKPLRKIPHSDIKKIENKLTRFKGLGAAGKEKVSALLVGGFRRKKLFSKDIDVMLCGPKSYNEILPDYIKYLNRVFKKRVYLYSKGEDKVSLIIQPVSNDETKKYKVDIFRTTPDNYYTMLLYSTGTREHNIKMRSKARRMGYLLNQDGLWYLLPNGKKADRRLNSSQDDEKKLFQLLEMKYVDPEDR